MTNAAPLLPYTVTIAGPERYDYEKPYTYVVNAKNAFDAAVKAAMHLSADIERKDLQFVAIVPGVPPENCGYRWNDRRDATLEDDWASTH